MSASNCLFQFWTWRRNGIEFSASDCDLYYCLLDSSVRFGGGKFSLSNKWLCNLLRVSLRTLQLARGRLVGYGLIAYENGHQGSPPVYEILDVSGMKHPQDAASSSIGSTIGSSKGSSKGSSQTSTKLEKGKSKKRKNISILVNRSLLPTNLQGDDFHEALMEFFKHRDEKNCTAYTEQGLKRVIKQLERWETEEKGKAVASINHSIMRNWQGIFECEPDKAKNQPKSGKTIIPDWKLDGIINDLSDELLRTYDRDERKRISEQIKEYKHQKSE